MNEVTFFFRDWEPIARIVVITVLGYAALLILLRSFGQRTLAKMTPFDFVITVTLGSAFGRVLTAQDVALLEVLVVFVVLIGLRWLIALARARMPAFSRAITPEPSLLYHDGQYVRSAMSRHRITEAELLTAARQQGMGSLEEAQAIVLESEGTFSVISPSQLGDGSAVEMLADLR